MRIAVLGPLEVSTDDGAPLTVPGAKERLLLAVLAAGAPDVVSTDRIVEVLWDGDAPATARRSLQAHVVHLRSALEPDRLRGSSGRYVVRRGTGYALAAGREEVDALRVADLTVRGRARLVSGDAAAAARLLREALALWRGEPYGDWPDADFAEAERRRLAEVRLGATTALLEARLELGEHADVVADVERLLAQDPLQEAWWRVLVIALYRCGRQGDALAAAQRARRVLAEELGVDPGPELSAIEAAVLRHDPVLAVPARAVPAAPADPSPQDAPCPYKGLASYQPSDAALFHGRRRTVTSLVARLVDAPVLVVSGPSGAGKSSVVRAGLIPALAAGALPGSAGWSAVVMTPGRRPVDALRELTGDDPDPAPTVLVCDQFEELWSPAVEPAERAAFLDTVLALLDDGIVVRCVVVVRGDQVGRLAEHPAFAERLGAGLLLVPPLTESELRDVVRGPAASVGLGVDDELVDAVVADVHGRPGALPLLSTALVGTWEQRRGTRLTLAGYLEVGGVAGALARSAESAWAALDGPARDVARRLLGRLADTGEGGAVVRRPVPLVELDLDGDRGRLRREVVDAFVARRLLSVDGGHLDVTHEALLTAWPRLERWLEEDAAGRALRSHLAPAAQDWERRGRPDDELYRGARLGAALEWAAEHLDDLRDVERRFLEASRAHGERELQEARDQVGRERRARRRARGLAAGLAVVLVLALVAGGLAVAFQRSAERRADEAVRASLTADANRLAALSAGVGEPDLSLLLAAQAARMVPNAETEDALLAALIARQRAVGVMVVGEEVRGSTLSGPGTLFLDDGIGVSALPADAGPGPQRPRRIGNWGRWVVADASPSEDLLVSAGSNIYGDMWVRLLTAAGDTRSLLESGDAEGSPIAVSFTPEGRRVLLLVVAGTGSADGRRNWWLTEFDVLTGEATDRGITGSLDGSVEEPAADISADGRTAVVYDRRATGDAAATLVDLAADRVVPLPVPERRVSGSDFRALPSGAVQMWPDGAVTLYGTDGRPQHVPGSGRKPVLDVVVSPDGTWAAAVGGGGHVALWDVDRGTGSWIPRDSFVGHAGDVRNAEVTRDGSRLITIGADDRIVVWDPTVTGGFGDVLGDLGGRRPVAPPQVVDPGRLAVAPTVADGSDGTVTVAATFLDLRTGAVVEDVEIGGTDAVEPPERPSVAVSPDGDMVAVSDGRTTTVLDVRTRDPLRRIRLPGGPGDVDAEGRPSPVAFISCLAWTPDSARVLLCTRADTISQPSAALVAVEVSTGHVEGDRIRYQGRFDAAALSPDLRTLAVTNLRQGLVILLGAESREVIRTRPVGVREGTSDIAYSPDGSRLAVTTESGHLFVVETTSGRALRPIIFGSALLQAEWWSDGRTLAVAAADGEVSLFDADRGQLRAPPVSASSGRPAEVYLVPAGRQGLVALTGVQPGRRWPLDPSALVERACAVAGRDLTRTEWDQYLPDRPLQPTCSGPG